MIIFLYGEDGYRLDEARRGIVEKYRAKHSSGLNLFTIDGAEPDATARLDEALQGLSFFDEIKLVVLKNPLTGDKDALLSVLQKSSVTKDAKVTVLACQSSKFDQRKPHPLLKFLADKENLVRNFEPLSGAQLSSWLRHQAVVRGTPFTAGALKLFMEIGGGDSWERANNLDKLANFCRGPITEKAVLALVGQPGSSNLFELIDAIGTRNRPQAYELLWRELAAGSDPYSILSMIAYQFRTM
ncbi:MAG TPA: DNA polymerase III subunit delta, partial [Candidatus Paceibacterota bacterium]|nr:DNA polymerase III subunit delta [Candidatus Paceibacterota bacterium]